MQTPLRISFKDIEPSKAIEARIREKTDKLEQLFARIVGCSVVVESPHQRGIKGRLYNVRIDVNVPGKDLHVGRASPIDQAHEDINVAIRDAFDAAGRLLEDHARKMRGEVKSHG